MIHRTPVYSFNSWQRDLKTRHDVFFIVVTEKEIIEIENIIGEQEWRIFKPESGVPAELQKHFIVFELEGWAKFICELAKTKDNENKMNILHNYFLKQAIKYNLPRPTEVQNPFNYSVTGIKDILASALASGK